ncbi:MAG: hypothetical protein R2845_15280 [Thermomicrobiales bacterium]
MENSGPIENIVVRRANVGPLSAAQLAAGVAAGWPTKSLAQATPIASSDGDGRFFLSAIERKTMSPSTRFQDSHWLARWNE